MISKREIGSIASNNFYTMDEESDAFGRKACDDESGGARVEDSSEEFGVATSLAHECGENPLGDVTALQADGRLQLLGCYPEAHQVSDSQHTPLTDISGEELYAG